MNRSHSCYDSYFIFFYCLIYKITGILIVFRTYKIARTSKINKMIDVIDMKNL